MAKMAERARGRGGNSHWRAGGETAGADTVSACVGGGPGPGVAAMEAPLHLLKPDATHTALVCIPEALAALRAIEGPVVVCSLVGTQRQGKSSLLNLLHKRSCVPPGFGIGHYMDPKTHGLHFWSKPHPRSDDTTLIFLDTEGLDAPHVDQFYNWTLSAVSLLISDVYMYQSKGSIDTNSIDRLAMILRVAEQLRGETSHGVRGVRGSRGRRAEDLESKSPPVAAAAAAGLCGLERFVFCGCCGPSAQHEVVATRRDDQLDSAALQTIRRC